MALLSPDLIADILEVAEAYSARQHERLDRLVSSEKDVMKKYRDSCPFCESRAGISWRKPAFSVWARPHCVTCDAAGPPFRCGSTEANNAARARDVWNTRSKVAGVPCPQMDRSAQHSDGLDGIRTEFAKPQFMTTTASQGAYSLQFSFVGEGARERCEALEDAFRAAGRAINGDAQ